MDTIKLYLSGKRENKSPYDIRIICLKTLLNLQEKIKLAENTYIDNANRGLVKSNTFKDLCDYTKQYRKEYNRCEEIIRK